MKQESHFFLSGFIVAIVIRTPQTEFSALSAGKYIRVKGKVRCVAP